jgi:hypothetical protein
MGEAAMAVGRSLVGGFRVLGQRSFWSFRVVHALLGSLLTVGGACAALFIGDSLRKHIAEVDNQIATATSRIDSISNTLLQFRIVQSNGVILGALSTSDGVRSEFRDSFTQLMFVLRRGPTLSLLGELYLHDLAAFRRERDELDRLATAAVAADRTRQSWEDVLSFEMTRERQLMELQDSFRARRFQLQAEKRRLESSLDAATIAGFIVQQLGFVVILLAGLIYQYAESRADVPRPGQSAQQAG